MQISQHKHTYNTLFFVGWIVMSIYLLLRTYYIDITDDEAWSYYNVKKFWWVETLCSGNTHWFNFAAIKVALLLGLEKAWQLRWLSVLSGIAFLYILYGWIKTLEHFYLKLFVFSFIAFNPFLLEYLTLARGYATGLCFLALSLYFMNQSFKHSDNQKLIFYSLLFAGASAIANYSFFYFFVAYCLCYFYYFYFIKGFQILKQIGFYRDGLYALGIIAFVLRALLFIKVCSNDIAEFGGEELVSSIFGSFIDTLLYRNISLHHTFKLILSWLLFLSVFGASLFGILKMKFHQNKLYAFTSCIVIFVLLFMVINNWCFHVLYPVERISLFFYPLMIVVLIGFVSCIYKTSSIKKCVMYVVSLFLALNFVININLISGYDHDYCMKTKRYFDYLKSIDAKKVGLQIELYFVYLKYYNVIDNQFYGESLIRYHYNKRWVKENKLNDFDYLLLFPPYDLSYYKRNPVRVEGVHFFEDSKALVVKVIHS